MMIDMDDPAHWARRKLVNKGFTPRRVRDQEAHPPRVRHDHRRGLRAGRVRLRVGHRRVAAADHDRRRARRRARGPRPTCCGGATTCSAACGSSDDETSTQDDDGLQPATREYASGVIAERGARRRRDDLMSVLVHAEVDGDRLDDDSLVHESLLILDRRRRDHPPRDQRRRCTSCSPTATSGSGCVADRALIDPAVEEMLRWVHARSRTWPAPSTARRRAPRPDARGGPEAAAALPVGQPRRGRVRRPVHASTSRARRTSTSRSASAPTSASGNSLARLELRVMFEQLLDRLPDLALGRRRANRLPARQLRQRLRVHAGSVQGSVLRRFERFRHNLCVRLERTGLTLSSSCAAALLLTAACAGCTADRGAATGLPSSSAPATGSLPSSSESASSTNATTESPCGRSSVAPSRYAHVVWIWMENHTSAEVIGSKDAPAISRLASACGTASDYSSIGSPSLPN